MEFIHWLITEHLIATLFLAWLMVKGPQCLTTN